MTTLPRKAWQGLPYLKKEALLQLSQRTGRQWGGPTRYYVMFSTRCNARCTMCYVVRGPVQELPSGVLLRLVRESRDLSRKGYFMSLAGGEPLILPEIYDVMQLGHELGMDMGVTTNGYLLTSANVKRLLAADPFNINVSLESADPLINERMRPFPDGTRKTLDGIANLMAEKQRTGSRVRIIVKPTISDINYRSLPDLIRHFGKDAPVQFQFQPYSGLEEGAKMFWVKDLDALAAICEEICALQAEGYGIIGDTDSFRGFVTYFREAACATVRGKRRLLDLKGKPRNCAVAHTTVFIDPQCNVHLCREYSSIGNLLNNSLSEIWHGEKAAKVRRQMQWCNIDCQGSCLRPITLSAKIRAFLGGN